MALHLITPHGAERSGQRCSILIDTFRELLPRTASPMQTGIINSALTAEAQNIKTFTKQPSCAKNFSTVVGGALNMVGECCYNHRY